MADDHDEATKLKSIVTIRFQQKPHPSPMIDPSRPAELGNEEPMTSVTPHSDYLSERISPESCDKRTK
ncbi:hypothetical protein ACLOJK_034774 [Asimina triloba]